MYPDKLKILYLEDVEPDVEQISRVLRKGMIAFELHVVTSKAEFIKALRDFQPDLILSDHNLPDINSSEALDILKETGIRIPFILVTGTVSEEFAARIILSGADDYVLKDRPERLPIAVKNVLEKFRVEKERQSSEDKMAASEKRYRAMIEKNADLITLVLPDGTILYASPSVTKILGYPFEEFASRPSFAYTHPDDVTRLMPQRIELFNTPGASLSFEQRLLFKNGMYRWFEGTTTNLLHEPAIGALVSNFRDITERKLAEEKLTHANRLYQFISEINQAITHTADEATLFRRACDIAVDTGKLGLCWIGMPDIVNKKVNVIAHNSKASAGDIKALQELDFDDDGPTANVMRSGACYTINDFRYRPVKSTSKIYATQRGYRSLMVLPIKKGGNTIATYNLLSAHAGLFDEKEVSLLKTAADDISFALGVFEQEKHRKQMEYETAHSKLRLDHAQAIAHFGHWELDFSTGIAEWSEEACRIYGLSTDDNLHTQQVWLSFIHPEDINHVNKIINESRETLSNFAYHHRIVRRDGTVRYIFSQAHFEFNAADEPVGLYGVAHDETEAKEAGNALAQSEANLRLIIDTIPQCLFAKDYFGKYLFVNKSYARLLGLTAAKILNQSFSKIVPLKSEADGFLSEDMEVIQSGKTKIIHEHTFTDPQGRQYIFSTVKMPYAVIGTNEKAILGISTDITDKKKAEQERSKMITDIVRRNNDLEQFSQIVSHNLRAPVAGIIGIVDILQNMQLDPAEEKNLRGYLSVAANNLDTVIRDLNRILQVKHTEHEIRESVRFSELVADIKVSFASLVTGGDVNILFDFSAVEGMNTIKSYLYSIFYNLISNSIKYRRPGVPPLIHISSERQRGRIEIVYRDNGLGMDLEKDGDNVFSLYKRFHFHVEGKGMGLFMVKTQVELLGGKITVSSEINAGTEFRIEFEHS